MKWRDECEKCQKENFASPCNICMSIKLNELEKENKGLKKKLKITLGYLKPLQRLWEDDDVWDEILEDKKWLKNSTGRIKQDIKTTKKALKDKRDGE